MKSKELERVFREGVREQKPKCLKKLNMKEVRNMKTHVDNQFVPISESIARKIN